MQCYPAVWQTCSAYHYTALFQDHTNFSKPAKFPTPNMPDVNPILYCFLTPLLTIFSYLTLLRVLKSYLTHMLSGSPSGSIAQLPANLFKELSPLLWGLHCNGLHSTLHIKNISAYQEAKKKVALKGMVWLLLGHGYHGGSLFKGEGGAKV